MPRHLVIGNGKFLINLDRQTYIRDLYYPYVGQLNHVGGYQCRIGLWVDGAFSWLSDPDWNIELSYAEDSLVTEVKAPTIILELPCSLTTASTSVKIYI